MKKLVKTICLLLAMCSLTFVACSKDDDEKENNTDDKIDDKTENKILSGKFSIAEGKYVIFSSGNLQYTNKGTHLCADGSIKRGTWRFATNQYDVVGSPSNYKRTDDDGYDYNNDYAGNVASSDNALVSSTYTGWIDLFCWGTSGYNDKFPYLTNNSGISFGDGEKDIKRTNYDWGVYNTIGSDAPGTWRTLTNYEWDYLLYTRTNAENLYGVGTVNGVNGCIILPDDWTLTNGVTFTAGASNDYGSEYYQTVNNYTLTQWQKMEDNGAVFLPAAGGSYGSNLQGVGYHGSYWYSTCYNGYGAGRFYFDSHDINEYCYAYRYNGQSVRLVKVIGDNDIDKANLKCESSVTFWSYGTKVNSFDDLQKCDSLIDEFRNSCVDFANNHTYVYDLEGESYKDICEKATEKYLNEKYYNDLNAAKQFVNDWQKKFLDFGTKNDVEINIPLIFEGRGLYKENEGKIYELLKSDSLGTMVSKLGNSGAII